MTEIPSCILSQYLWYSQGIQVDKAPVHFLQFSRGKINYVSQIFSDNGSIKKWHEFKREYNLHAYSYFQQIQLIDSIPERWKFIIKGNLKMLLLLSFMTHHLITGSRVITLDKLKSTKIYFMLISTV